MQWSPGKGLTLRPSWSRRCQVRPSSFVPAVPPTCHKQRSPAVSDGQSRSLREGRWAGRQSLTCGSGTARNCMACKRSYRIGWASRPCPRLLASGCADGPELRVRLWLAAWSSRPPPAAPPTACPGDLLAQPSTQLVDRLGGWDYRARPGDTRPWRPSADHPPRLLGNVLVGCARWRRSVGASDGVTGRLPSFSRSRDLVDGAGWAAATGLAMSTDSREPCRRGERQGG